jgi:hypothetical protein
MDGIASRSGTHRMSHVAAAVFQERPATELPARLALILNLKENGYLHLASRASMHSIATDDALIVVGEQAVLRPMCASSAQKCGHP